MIFANVDLEDHFLGASFPLTLFLPPLPWGSLSPEGRDVMETAHLGLSVSKSLTLCTRSGCGSLCSYLLLEEVSLMMVAVLLCF